MNSNTSPKGRPVLAAWRSGLNNGIMINMPDVSYRLRQ